jgi:hypothetical protein
MRSAMTEAVSISIKANRPLAPEQAGDVSFSSYYKPPSSSSIFASHSCSQQQKSRQELDTNWTPLGQDLDGNRTEIAQQFSLNLLPKMDDCRTTATPGTLTALQKVSQRSHEMRVEQMGDDDTPWNVAAVERNLPLPYRAVSTRKAR